MLNFYGTIYCIVFLFPLHKKTCSLSCKVPLPKGDLTQWLDSTASEKDKKSLKSFFKALQDFKKSSSDQNTIMYHVAPTLDAQVVFRVTEL